MTKIWLKPKKDKPVLFQSFFNNRQNYAKTINKNGMMNSKVVERKDKKNLRLTRFPKLL